MAGRQRRGEMITALRRGEIDLAMSFCGAGALAHDYYIHKLGSVPSLVAPPNVVMIPIAEKEATWDLFVVWQRGKSGWPVARLVGRS